jgi:hypothetical protein
MRYHSQSVLSLVTLTLSLCGAKAQIPVVPLDFAGAKQPQIALQNNGTIFVAFGQSNTVFATVSVDGGKSFLPKPVMVGKVDKLALGMRRGPRIFAGPKFITITAISHEKGELYSWTSSDAGKSWGEPVVVNDVKTSAREGMHGMTGNARGELFAVWLDLRNKGTQLWGARSSDGGKTWEPNIKVYESPEKSICECCHPSALWADDGKLIVMWRNSLNGNRDMYQAISANGGKSFSPATKLGSDSWVLKGCPMDGGSLTSAQGKIINVWRRGTSIYTSAGDGSEQRIAESGLQPIVISSPDGKTEYIWQKGPNLYFKENLNAPEKLLVSEGGYATAIAPQAMGKLLVAYESSSKNGSAIQLIAIENNKTK